jgi:hypothetical protein
MFFCSNSQICFVILGATTSRKRLRSEDPFYFPATRQKGTMSLVYAHPLHIVAEVTWLAEKEFQDVLEVRSPTIFYIFGAKDFLPVIQQWDHRLSNPLLLTQQKSLLIIDGAVKSGKTTLAKLIPFLYREAFAEKEFCFGYLDLSTLSGLQKPLEKWMAVSKMFRMLFKSALEDQAAPEDYYDLRASLQSLHRFQVKRWIIVLDECHFLFDHLDSADTCTMAEQWKHLLLDEQSPCYFVLVDGTQASLWWSIHQPRPSGLNLLTGATLVTTSFTSSDDQIERCKKALIQKEGATAQQLDSILDLLPIRNVATLCQVQDLGFPLICNSRFQGD